ncbi:hypothetical protein K7I13_04440 [Brucepastera parasyntrophica]|uniref:hypothetical protein n=1 Tax=Brucepastera parasyntrophica TaxID=2880008 RepID=UPI00210D8435|nr:hypothetical protein [Brucepastera parasyntrophica]ULQ60546.1 hypothetical protein K7I13_04440 [Brucepastera parasyntrophica]
MKLLYFLHAILLFSVFSCSAAVDLFNGMEEITIELPEIHPALMLEGSGTGGTWTIRWYTEGGREERCFASGKSCSIKLRAGSFTPILAEPGTAGHGIPPGSLPAAGALYPLHAGAGKKSQTVDMTWMRGITANTAEQIFRHSEDGYVIASRFNWKRFEEKLAGFELPEQFNRERFFSALFSGKFRATDIAKGSISEITLTLLCGSIPDGTGFISAWPDRSGFIWENQKEPVIYVQDGQSFFFSAIGYLEIQVSEGRLVCAGFYRYEI